MGSNFFSAPSRTAVFHLVSLLSWAHSAYVHPIEFKLNIGKNEYIQVVRKTYLLIKRRKNVGSIGKLSASGIDLEPIELRVHVDGHLDAVT